MQPICFLPFFWLVVLGSLLAVPVSAQSVNVDTTRAGGDTTLEAISLESLLDVKVSAAARYEQSAREAASSVTIITAEDIERYGYRTLSQVLANVRGFYINDTREQIFAGTRGFNRLLYFNNRMLLLVNGHTVNESSAGYFAVDQSMGVDLSLVERIEIVRGPSSALYGTGAMFAVINMVTKEADALNGLEVAVGGGSHGTRTAVANAGADFGHRRQAIVSGYWGDVEGQHLYFPEYDTPQTNNGIADHQDWRRYYGATTRVLFGDLSLQGNIVVKHMGVPTALHGILFNHEASELQEHQRYAGLTYEKAVRTNLRVRAVGNANLGRQRMTAPVYIEQLADSVTSGYVGWSRWYGGEIQVQWDTSPTNRLIGGVEYKDAHAGTETFIDLSEPPFYRGGWHYGVFAAFVQNEYRLSRNLALTLGLRHDRYSLYGSATTPRAALVYHPLTTTTVKALYGEAFRAPGLFESEMYDFQFNISPNPDLGSERIRTLELVWDQKLTSALHSTVSLYNYRMYGLIDSAYDPARQVTQNQNIGSVDARGFEWELTARVRPDLQGYASYAYAFTRDAATDERLTNSPAHLAKAGLYAPVPGGLVAAVQARYESARRTLRGALTDPFLVTDVTLSTRKIAQHLNLSLSVRNMFDVRYSYPGTLTHRQEMIEQNGRSLYLRVGFTL